MSKPRSIGATIAASLLGRGILKLIPILVGIVTGYVASVFLGMVHFDTISAAPWFAIPNFTFPQWNWEAVLFIVPVAIAPAIEHFGDILAISSVTGKNFLKDPGVHRTMLGDGLATTLASCLGGPPNTTYSEVTGAVALTRAFNPAIMTCGVGLICGRDIESSFNQEFVKTLGLWCGVLTPAKEATLRIASKVAVARFKSVPGKVFQKINQRVGTTILTKYGTKRGGIAVGRLIPFGIGALVGGGFNLATMKGFKVAAIRHFRMKDDTVLVMEVDS